jgi:hypothetical protein
MLVSRDGQALRRFGKFGLLKKIPPENVFDNRIAALEHIKNHQAG